jgi:hypothetical protein
MEEEAHRGTHYLYKAMPHLLTTIIFDSEISGTTSALFCLSCRRQPIVTTMLYTTVRGTMWDQTRHLRSRHFQMTPFITTVYSIVNGVIWTMCFFRMFPIASITFEHKILGLRYRRHHRYTFTDQTI